MKVRAYHPYLRLATTIGLEDYLKISQSSWAAEAVFAKLLFPGHEGPEELFYKALGRKFGKGKNPDFERVVSQAEAIVDRYFSPGHFAFPRMTGISLCLNQLTAGLYIAKKIKAQAPNTIIVLGGASCSDVIGQSLLEIFPFVDYTITGEGELPLLELWRYLMGKKKTISSSAICSRTKGDDKPKKDQIPELDQLPLPDFDDYFLELSQLGGTGAGISPLIPIEASRGCWWARCNFCNLNLQWKGYRAKSSQRVVSEIDYLSKRYMILDFAFMDNCLPKRQTPKIFQLLSRQKKDYSFFAELRVGHSRQELGQMAAGGLKDAQVGIEALSTRLLQRLNKGSSAIDNLAIMRHCTEWGIELQANLILHFPGSSNEEVMETLENLDFAWPFSPLKTVSFWLGADSPVYREPENFGIYNIRNHGFYTLLFPKDTANGLRPLILEYTGDRTRQKNMWRAVEKKVAEMNKARSRMKIKGKLLGYRDGGEFITIRQILPDGRILRHRLSGLSRKLYLACLEPTAVERLAELAEGTGMERIDSFVNVLCSKRLMFREGHKVLSLAVREKIPVPMDRIP